MKRARRRGGFSLLEAIVATTVMALAVTGAMTAINDSLRNSARVSRYDEAALLAKSKMSELLHTPRLPRNVILQGLFPPQQVGELKAGWRAQATIFEPPPTLAPGWYYLERIDLEVWWGEAEERRTFRLESYRRSLLTPEDIAVGGGGLR